MIKAVSFWTEFLNFFGTMNYIALFCLVFGLALVILEIFLPSRKLFAILGTLLILLGAVARLSLGGSFAMFFILCLFVCLIVIFAQILMTFMYRRGWLNRTPQPTAPLKSNIFDYYFLLGLEGVAQSDLEPQGIICINGVEFEGLSSSDTIARDSKIKVIEVEGTRVVVKKI